MRDDTPSQDAILTARQQREREYHSQFATKHSESARQPPSTDVLFSTRRKWWLSYWKAYDFVLEANLLGKRVFVPGCGLGTDAIRLAALGAEVYASDISPELVEMARERAECAAIYGIRFDVLPAESTGYQDAFFDAALFVGVFHHIDIPSSLAELRRIMKPGAILIAHEVYSHAILQRIRDSRLVVDFLYPALAPFIYGSASYITEDEHKLTQSELDLIRSQLTGSRVEYFNMLSGRLFPTRMAKLCRLERTALKAVGPLGRLLAGRVVVAGHMLRAS